MCLVTVEFALSSSKMWNVKNLKTPSSKCDTRLSVANQSKHRKRVCGRLYSPRPPPPPIASFWFQARGKESVLNQYLVPGRPPGVSSDRRRLNLCGPRWPEEAGLDLFRSATLCRGLVPDPDFFVAGHLRRSGLPGTNETNSFSHACNFKGLL